MAFTIDERKAKYNSLVLEQGEKLYATWAYNKTPSKKIVKQAKAYAFDKRLKTDAAYRFRVLPFVCALTLRVDKRYRSFFRKLFLLFAFLGERSALRLLKFAFGYLNDTPLQAMLDSETRKLATQLAGRNDEQQSGGKRVSDSDEMTIEQELQDFFDEMAQLEEQALQEDELAMDSAEELEAENEVELAESDGREKITVDEFALEKLDADKEATKDDKENEPEREETKQVNPTENSNISEQKGTQETGKSVANTSIIAEMMAQSDGQEKELPSPFPVFRDSGNDGEWATENSAVDTAHKQENVFEMKNASEAQNDMHYNAHNEAGRGKSPFPVFGKGDRQEARGAEKPIEKEKIGNEKEPSKETMFVSEENKRRRELNVTMSKEEILAIAEKLKASADLVMQKAEQEWREKISVTEKNQEHPLSGKMPKTVHKDSFVLKNPKK